MNKRFTISAGAAAVALLISGGAFAQQDISPDVITQMKAIGSTKASFNAAQKKMDSDLAFGILAVTGDPRVGSYLNAITTLTGTDIDPSTQQAAPATPSSSVLVEIVGDDVDAIANAVIAANGTVTSKYPQWKTVNASVPVVAVESVAASAAVRSIRVPSAPDVHVGSVTSQGYVTHEASKAVAAGYNGNGVTVGVMSDSALPARVAALIASGDLDGAKTSVLSGRAGPTTGTDEGAAMMEIVHDMAPGANIIFSTAYNTPTDFANNILALAAAGCRVIVDDISYFNEGVFQDGPIAQAVNTVTAAGVVYFSSAGNSGSVTKGTSGTWEGDFKDGGPISGTIYSNLGETGNYHNFASTGTQNYDLLTNTSTRVSVKWSDPLGKSNNDYDLFLLNPAGTAITKFSAAGQSGTQDPYETVTSPTAANPAAVFAAGSRVVVVLYDGAARALHVDTSRSTLSIATTGATFGHNAAASTMTTAATYWNSGKMGSRPFTGGAANTNESFSSDGPRKIFFNPDGTTINGSVLFATNGGTTLSKPDIAAADGVTTHTPGFLPFFGTSAAAPHAAGIAALILQARPDYTVAQVKAAMKATALDTMAAGVDRDSGSGIAMANAAVQYALTHN